MILVVPSAYRWALWTVLYYQLVFGDRPSLPLLEERRQRRMIVPLRLPIEQSTPVGDRARIGWQFDCNSPVGISHTPLVRVPFDP